MFYLIDFLFRGACYGLIFLGVYLFYSANKKRKAKKKMGDN